MRPERLILPSEGCSSADLLAAFSLGDLPDGAFEAVAEHAAGCGHCEALFDQIAGREDKLVRGLRTHLAGSTCTVETAGFGLGRGDTTVPERCGGYELIRPLGQGGMGVVYLARQGRPSRLVAVKLASGGRADRETLARFRTEVEAVGRLRHPNIVQVHEYGEQDGRPFFSMEYVAGGSLAERLAGTPVPAREAAELVRTLARAVHAAHEEGVVHRDLKPANVLLDADGAVKLTDFGLAKLLDADEGAAGLTLRHAVVGTASYMAPEQASGRSEAVGPRTDVYSLGAVLYECLTGRPPFKAADPGETLRQVAEEDPVPPRRLNRSVPRDLETVCLKCLRKDPRDRYPTSAALADDLGRFAAGRPVLARPTGPARRLARWARRRPATAALVVLLAAALTVASTVVSLHQSGLRAARLDGLIEALVAAEPERVPGILQELRAAGADAEARLRDLRSGAPDGSAAQFRLALALAEVNGAEAEVVCRRALVGDPQDLFLAREALGPRLATLAPSLWAAAESPMAPAARRFRAACLLASLPWERARWAGLRDDVVAHLVSEDPVLVGGWVRLAGGPVRCAYTPAPLR